VFEDRKAKLESAHSFMLNLITVCDQMIQL
jgi:hypothetical protein